MPITQDHLDRIAAAIPQIGRDPASVLRRIEAMEQLLEKSFTMPVLGRRFGLDFLVGLVPVLGDAITTAMGAWIVWEARNLGMPKWKIARMVGNVGFDALLGLVPLVGDAADCFFRSNTRNLKIIKNQLGKHHPATVTIEGKVRR